MSEICGVLAHLNDEGLLSIRSLEKALGIKERCGYPYVNDRAIDADQMRHLMLSKVVNVGVQSKLLSFLTDDTAWFPIFAPVPDDFDTSEILDRTIPGLHACADALSVTRAGEKAGFRNLGLIDAKMLEQQLHENLLQLVNAIRAVGHLSRAARAQPTATP